MARAVRLLSVNMFVRPVQRFELFADFSATWAVCIKILENKSKLFWVNLQVKWKVGHEQEAVLSQTGRAMLRVCQ